MKTRNYTAAAGKHNPDKKTHKIQHYSHTGSQNLQLLCQSSNLSPITTRHRSQGWFKNKSCISIQKSDHSVSTRVSVTIQLTLIKESFSHMQKFLQEKVFVLWQMMKMIHASHGNSTHCCGFIVWVRYVEGSWSIINRIKISLCVTLT